MEGKIPAQVRPEDIRRSVSTLEKIRRGDLRLHARVYPDSHIEFEVWDMSLRPQLMIKGVEEKVLLARILLDDPDSKGYGRPIKESDLRKHETETSGLGRLMEEDQIRSEGETVIEENRVPPVVTRKPRKKAAAQGGKPKPKPSRRSKKKPGPKRKVGRPRKKVTAKKEKVTDATTSPAGKPEAPVEGSS